MIFENIYVTVNKFMVPEKSQRYYEIKKLRQVKNMFLK